MSEVALDGTQPGEQPRGGIGRQFVDVGDPAHRHELERQQRQDRRRRRDHLRPGVAGLGHETGKIQGHQLGDRQVQPGHLGGAAPREGGEVDNLGAGKGFFLYSPPGGMGPGPLAGEALLGQHFGDSSAIERGVGVFEGVGDLVGRVPRPAQRHDAGTGGILGRGGLGAGLEGNEELPAPRPEIPHCAVQSLGRPAHPGCRLRRGRPLHEVGPQRLVAPLRRLAGSGEELPSWAHWIRPISLSIPCT